MKGFGEQLNAQHAQTSAASTELAAREGQVKELTEQLKACDDQVNDLTERLKAQQARTSDLSRSLAARDAKLAVAEAEDKALKRKLAELEQKGARSAHQLEETVHALFHQLETDAVELEAAVNARDRAERLGRHLSYRLGQALLEGTRSIGGIVRLPGLIMRARRDYRRDTASGVAPQGARGAQQRELTPVQFLAGPDPTAFGTAVSDGSRVRLTGRAIGRSGQSTLSVVAWYRGDAGAIVPLGAEQGSSGLPDDADVCEIVATPLEPLQLEFRCPPRARRMEVAFASAGDARILVCINDVLVSEPGRDGAEAASGAWAVAGKRTRAPDNKPAKPRVEIARGLDDKLWGGFSRYALHDLEALKRSRTAAAPEVAYAAWALARWHAVRQDYGRALENVVTMRLADRTAESDMGQVLLEAGCLTRLGERDAARKLLTRMLEERPHHADLYLAMADTYSPVDGPGDEASDGIRLSWINRVYENAGLLGLVKADPEHPLSIDNLATENLPTLADAAAPADRPRVSVIMPVYNAQDTLPFALRGLLAQTWCNFEIILVDDCSHDGTVEVAEEFARHDPRIRLVRQARNQGAYPARNKGLETATGSLITVHDSDDWSHPQKIEWQVRLMSENPGCRASMSQWIRVGEQMNVVGPWIAKNSLFDLNFSSLMVRRQVVDEIGGWDEVRVNGDAEYRSRILKAYGEDAICTVKDPAVLSFALTRPASLTQSGPTNIRTLKYGLRGQYRDAYDHWHSKGRGDPAKLRMDTSRRPYVVPLGITMDPERERRYDLVVVSDYGLYGGAFGSTLHYILAAREAGMSVAVYHWRKYDRKPVYNLNPRLYDACAEHGIDILTVGDTVVADAVLIGYPAILQHLPDAVPEVETGRVLVIVNQYAQRMVDGSDPQYDPAVARANLKQVFGQEGLWIPLSNWVRRLMSEDPRYTAPYPEPWHPMIRLDDWFGLPIRWNGHQRARPVVGRHSRDAYTKWPATAEALKLAYGVGQPWDMRFLGGAAHATELIGFTPDNWTVVEFDGLAVTQFLADLDFFIHYPHEAYIEEFGRAVLEAMAAGRPVVLPFQFKETFGEAALYAEPADVAGVINHLWADEAAYLDRARAGREFVMRSSDLATFPERLAKTRAYLDDAASASASAT